MVINNFFFQDARKQLEKFSLNFSSCDPFPSSPSTGKDTSLQFQCTNITIVNKNSPLFVGFPQHKYTHILAVQRYAKKPVTDRAP